MGHLNKMTFKGRKSHSYYSKMELNMRESGSKTWTLEMEEEFRFGQMGLGMRATGETTELME